MIQEDLVMTEPTSQGDVKIYIPGKRDVIVKMSGGADSSILMFLLAKYKNEYNTELNFKITSTVGSTKPYQYEFASQVVKFIDKIYPLGDYKHYHNESLPSGEFPDGEDENGFDANKEAYSDDIEKLVQSLHNKDSVQYMGITANPSAEQLELHNIADGRDLERDSDVAVPTNELWMGPSFWKYNRPFAKYDKMVVAELYDRYNLTDTLFPLTRSCEEATFDFSEHCGTCWWCKERKWAFGKLA
tara:strand:+ start:1100 stop:1831 length:732 start_codon:yes stop_codon:yes gene_type:complete